jgi:DNA mismatch repair protein MutS
VIRRAKQVMGQIEKHSKIAMGLRQGIQKKKVSVPSIKSGHQVEQLDIFAD